MRLVSPLVGTACPGTGRALPSAADGGFARTGEVRVQSPEFGKEFTYPKHFRFVCSVSEHTKRKTLQRS